MINFVQTDLFHVLIHSNDLPRNPRVLALLIDTIIITDWLELAICDSVVLQNDR